MNQKEVGELRRRWKPDKCAVTRIYGCFVNSTKELVTDLDESLALLPPEEQELYLGFLKKALSGTLGKHLVDIVFSTAQLADSDEHRLLMALRDSELQDSEIRHKFYKNVIENLDMGDQSYLLLLAHDSYDVPKRRRDNSNADSENVFSYILCAICPIKEGKQQMGYFPGDNEFHCSGVQTVAAPELGFLFPAFDDRAANLYNALFYTRKPNELHQDFLDAVFHIEPLMSACEQREAFENALCDALGETCSMDVVQAVHERLADKLAQHKESRDPEPLVLLAADICAILLDCGVSQEMVTAFQSRCDDAFGPDAALNPANLIDPSRFLVRTSQATLSLDPDSSYLMETRVLEGKKFILIPAEEDVEVNGLPVRLTAAPVEPAEKPKLSEKFDETAPPMEPDTLEKIPAEAPESENALAGC